MELFNGMTRLATAVPFISFLCGLLQCRWSGDQRQCALCLEGSVLQAPSACELCWERSVRRPLGPALPWVARRKTTLLEELSEAQLLLSGYWEPWGPNHAPL